MSVNASDVYDKELHDKHACAELIQAWGLYRDQGKWPQLLATFVPEGEISVSWFSGSFREFVAQCRESFEAGQRSKHQIFPSYVRIARARALAETSIVILVRQTISGVLADLTSYARFLDRLERRDRYDVGFRIDSYRGSGRVQTDFKNNSCAKSKRARAF